MNPLKVRSTEHLSDVINPLAVNILMASGHFAQVHQGNCKSFSFTGIEKVSRPLKGGDKKKKLQGGFLTYKPGSHMDSMLDKI